jgi:hypothetical protein
MKRAGLIAVMALALLTSGCGNGSDGGASVNGCLGPGQVSAEVNRIAEGAEGSTAEVEAKQAEIQDVEAEAC